MKTFMQWAEVEKKELPMISEKTHRAGIAHWAYPDAYARQQYPDLYFVPRAADALQKMGDHKPDRKGVWF